MSDNKFPPGWDEKKAREVAEHYDTLSDEDAAAEIDRAYEDKTTTVMHIPVELVPAVRELLNKRGKAA